MNALRTLVAVAAVTCFGCATSYTPRSSPYAVPIQSGPNPDFMREGQRVELGFWGNGARAVVRGNPAAEERIRGYQGQRTVSLVFSFLTEAALISSGALLIASEGSNHPNRMGAGFALVPVSLLLLITAGYYTNKSRTTLLDAVNIYNDGIQQHRLCPP